MTTIIRKPAPVSATAIAIEKAFEKAYQMAMQPTFKLDLTRRVYAIDCMTGERTGYFVRDFAIVG